MCLMREHLVDLFLSFVENQNIKKKIKNKMFAFCILSTLKRIIMRVNNEQKKMVRFSTLVEEKKSFNICKKVL